MSEPVRPAVPSLINGNEVSRREALVRHSPLFSDIPGTEFREIVSAAHEKHFGRRQTIFLEGDPVRQIVMLTSGNAKTVQFCQNGAEVILRVKGPGEVVGTLHTFCVTFYPFCDGRNPLGLVQGTGGNFYGLTVEDGPGPSLGSHPTVH